MKLGIVGAGQVGSACVMAAALRGVAREIVLVDRTRELATHERVLSTGTWLDSLRFRTHLAAHLDVSPETVEAQVLGEHGTSSVFLWSGCRVAGVPIEAALKARGPVADDFRAGIEREVRYANITIIEGNGASIYGIAMAAARIAEAVLRDERLAVPIGAYSTEYGVTLSLPSVLGRDGVAKILAPAMAEDERQKLAKSATALKEALASLK